MEGRREIELDGQRVAFELRVSARARTLRAEIRMREGLRVTLPDHMDEGRVAPFLQSRRRWVLRTLRRVERWAKVIPHRRFIDGERVPYLGAEVRLDVRVGAALVDRKGHTLIVQVPRRTEGAVRRALEAWYLSEAERELLERVHRIAGAHDMPTATVRVRDMKTRWGSCTAGGTLTFNWRLLLAPEPIVDYLVAHELAHCSVRNHSERFWERVEEIDPAWREAEQWLRRYGRGLVL